MADKRIYDYRGFTGTDVSIGISLFEYGFIWKQTKNDYHFIYGVESGDTGNYVVFDQVYLPINTDIYDEYDWVDWAAVYNYTGTVKAEFDKESLPYKIYALISYYGYNEVFGGCWSFTISE